MVVSADADGTLRWHDANGPLRGEVPWVLRTDVTGPATTLVVETPEGDLRARRVTFDVLAAGATAYTVVLVSDLDGRVSWSVTSPGKHELKLFTCQPRPAEEPRRECLRGGIPKPLLGELVGGFTAERVDGEPVAHVRGVRFERASPKGAGDSG